MAYERFSVVKGWVRSGYGECDTDTLAEVVNAIREHLYSWYADLPLFLDAAECFQLHDFCVNCNACSDTYKGITLPRDFLTVEAMWWNDWPIVLQNEWREFQVGMSSECDCKLEKFDVAGRFPTAMDLRYQHPKKLRALAVRSADAGKKLKIRGINGAGVPHEYTFTLTTQAQNSPDQFRSINQVGGVVKDATVGRVILADEDDRLLSIYEADETMPAYRRIKITGLREGVHCVNIRAARKFYPLTDDDDVVETDNRMVFDSMARYLRLYRKADKTGDDLRAEKDHYATARGLMMGTVSREIGKSTRTELVIATPTIIRHSGLLRNRTFRL